MGSYVPIRGNFKAIPSGKRCILAPGGWLPLSAPRIRRMDSPFAPIRASDVLQRNHVQVLGQTGPVLLYAHGFGCNQHMWDRITPAFAASHRQVLFDYVGSGRSDPAAFSVQRYSQLGGYAQDLLEVCDALGLRSGVTLVAHSVSCSIGMLAAITRPDLFESVVMVGPSPCFLNHPPDYHGGFERQDLLDLLALMDQNYMGWASYLAPVVAGAGADGSVTHELSDSFCSTDPVRARTFAEATFFADNRQEVGQVPVPCLVLQHRRDTLAPCAVGEYMHRHLPRSTLKVLEVAGHCGHMSHPALVVEAMQTWLARKPGT